MAVPAGIPVEQSISEIDAEIRMEDIRQSPAARLKMEHFHGVIKRNLMDKKLNYEAEHRKEILEGLKHMKRRLPAESGTSLVKKLENLAVNLECTHQNQADTFLMKSDHDSGDLTLCVQHKNDQAISAKITYFGDEFPTDSEITRRMNDNEWEDVRMMINSMLKIIPSNASRDSKQKLSRYRQSLERNLLNKWNGDAYPTISMVNKSVVGWPIRGTSVRPMRIVLYGEPGVEIELKEKGIGGIDIEKGELPYAQIVIVESDEMRTFACGGSTFSFAGIVKVELSSSWLLSATTLDLLDQLGARPTTILQKTNLIRLIANCQMKDGDIELIGNDLGRNVRYLVKGVVEEKDVIVDSLLVDNGERLEEILVILHHQAVFNASWESIVTACCTTTDKLKGVVDVSSLQHTHFTHSTQFEMNTNGCTWDIIFTGNGTMYNVRLYPSAHTRQWNLNINTLNDAKLANLAARIEDAFNRTWSLSKCLCHLVKRLNIDGYEWQAGASMDTSFPRSDCSHQYESKVGPAWLRKDIPAMSPAPNHKYDVKLPEGRCKLLRMMREVKPRPPLKVARPRPQLSNPTVPPLRVNRLDAGLPPLQPHQAQTPFNHMENMVKGMDDRQAGSPMGGMEGGGTAMYGHPGYPPQAMGVHRMGLPPGTSPLARGAMPGMGGYNPAPHPSYSIPQQQEIMRQQQFMRQQSAASMAAAASAFDFHDDSRGSSPSSVNDLSPGYGNQFPGYAPPQSPLVRGGAAGTKTRRARGRKAGNVGDRTPGSSIDSPSSSGFSPDTKRPKSGPGSRGGRGSRGKRGISMDQSIPSSPFQRSVSEMSNSMSSPLPASVTPLYSQQSFDEGTSDEECDPPPFSRSLSTSVQPPSASLVTAPSRLSSGSSSSFTISSSPLATPPVSQPLPSTPIISVVPSPLVPPPITTSSTPTLSSVLSAPPTLPASTPSATPSSTPSSFTTNPMFTPGSVPSSITSTFPSPSTSTSSTNPAPTLVRRKSSLDTIVNHLNATNTQKKKALGGGASDLFDTGLDDSSPHSSSQSTAPSHFSESKIESPKKEGEEKIVLKLKTKKDQKKKKDNPEKEKEKDKKKEDKNAKTGEEKDRKRKAESTTKDKKDKEAKKAKIEPPLIETESSSGVTRMSMLKDFRIPKNKKQTDQSSSSSSSSVPPLTSPSVTGKTPLLATPSTSFASQSKGGPIQGGPPPSFRPPPVGPMKGPVGPRQHLQAGRQPKSILKTPGQPGPPPGPLRGPPPYLPERKASHPPYHEPPRTRQPSGGPVYPPPPLHTSLAPPTGVPPPRRGPLLKGVPPGPPNWMAPPPRGPLDGPPTLTPAMPSGPNISSRMDRPPTLESNLPSRSIIDDSPASPDGLQIVDDADC